MTILTKELLRRKAENRYRDVLRALILDHSPFPLDIRIRLPAATAPLAELRAAYDAIRSQSKQELDYGYSVEWEDVRMQRYGRNEVPQRLYFSSSDDFLRYLGKKQEAEKVLTNARRLMEAFPFALEWAASNPAHLVKPEAVWGGVIQVIQYLIANPFPGIWARSMPLAVPSKFVESESALLESLIKAVAPQVLSDEGESFEERAGFLTKDSLIELRFPEKTAALNFPFGHFMATGAELNRARDLFSLIRNVIVVENHVTFLALPVLKDALFIMGEGFAVHRLARIEWLREKCICYWGDIDVQGFEILAGLRRIFPQVRSILMDFQTFQSHESSHQPGKPAKTSVEVMSGLLSSEEMQLYQHVRQHVRRLEQEKIDHAFACNYINDRIYSR